MNSFARFREGERPRRLRGSAGLVSVEGAPPWWQQCLGGVEYRDYIITV